MKAETKFDVAQDIWTIIDGKAKCVPITLIEIKSDNRETTIRYFVNKGTKDVYQCDIIDESRCYATKQELIDNL